MPTLGDIERQLSSLDGLSKFFGRKEIKELPSIMHADEYIIGAVQGMYNNGQGMLVLTERRMIFIDKGFFGGAKIVDFFYDKISSVAYKGGLLLASIEVFVSGNKQEITHVDKEQGKTVCERIREKLHKPASAPQQPSGSVADELVKLAALRDSGVLTQEEFETQKKKLLS